MIVGALCLPHFRTSTGGALLSARCASWSWSLLFLGAADRGAALLVAGGLGDAGLAGGMVVRW